MQVMEREALGQGTEGGPALPEAQVEQPDPPKAPAFDLFSLVLSSKRLELYLEPLQDAWEGIRFLLQWRMPLCSLLTCLALNFLLLTLTQAAWFVLCALLVLVPALLGYLGEVCWARPPAPELLRRRYHSVRREDLRQVRLARHEAIAEVKRLFYGVLLGSLCLLYLLPLCWVLALLNSALFLGSAEFGRVLLEMKAVVEQHLSPKAIACTPASAEPDGEGEGGGAPADRTPTPTTAEDLTPSSVEEAEEAEPEPDEEFKDAIEEAAPLAVVSCAPAPGSSGCGPEHGWAWGREPEPGLAQLRSVQEDDEVSQCSAEFELPDSGAVSRNEVIRSRVSRLTERLRKRYPSNNFGTCTGCAATFSVLKKRPRTGAELQPGGAEPGATPGPAYLPRLPSGAAATAETASAPAAAPTKSPSPPWEPQRRTPRGRRCSSVRPVTRLSSSERRLLAGHGWWLPCPALPCLSCRVLASTGVLGPVNPLLPGTGLAGV
ncbi:protrudin isoform X2 [Carettochelys insculpta]|uniref:protrudin isoform X2 n=1 Tax=Carettochelys insculpta TaxID=44489 RepID=UPI003EBB9672